MEGRKNMRKIVYLAFSLLTFYLAGVYRLDVLMFLFFHRNPFIRRKLFPSGVFSEKSGSADPAGRGRERFEEK